ncbi:3-oxoacyl-ACP reductase [Nocardioides szechwanensis]|uniref:NAD(P)-dependent dehydrogenase, short-chain alcohol dehydrogenase family n=1 Tax=Nocardioides szechwanensis TaxID=1005944 RepID=A0A1H0FBC4_9ACTN|nr:SDR family NAD(P)-dependent oxidoreductase [Nocardioides szechwanensis]GEP36200.1 3-oxoacyl-ACP reductase [Nocardioides szechwanensis]SDN91856.1 NAD(P)-dependent dehydrogenase, short-chain alcohol dehydrogenase family [Nocardioides szechwanensis]
MSETPAPSQRVVVITGAASGIGFATAELFRDAGDLVFGLDIQPTVPDDVTYVECNVGDRASVDAAIAVCAAHGRIDVLANVAGIVQFGRFEQISDAEWDRVHAVDLKGPFMMMQAAMPYLKACRGNIVNVSSVAGNVAQPYATAYAAAKGGLTMLTKALALELSPDNIRVNAICPGTVDTPIVSHVASIFPDDLDPRVADRLMMMLPGRAIAPAEIGSAIVYLASKDARMITGAILAFDGGMS